MSRFVLDDLSGISLAAPVVHPKVPPPLHHSQPPGGMDFDGQYKPFTEHRTPPDSPPTGPAPDLFALAGATGKKATDLLRDAMDLGAKTFAELARPAIGRLAVDPHWRTAPTLFTPDELHKLATALASVTTPADLLARAAVLRKAEQARAHGATFNDDLDTFAWDESQHPRGQPGNAGEWGPGGGGKDAPVKEHTGRSLEVEHHQGNRSVPAASVAKALADEGLPAVPDDNGASAVVKMGQKKVAKTLADKGWKHESFQFKDGNRVDAFSKGPYRATVAEDTTQRTAVLISKVPDPVKHATHFAEFAGFDSLDTFAEPIPIVKPQEAIDYFLKLVPKLGLDPERYGLRMERHAFTMAVATEKTLLEKVKAAIGDYLETGGVPKGETGAHLVQTLLDEVGVTPANSQYSDMIWRSNVASAYNAGLDAQLADPDLMAEFSVWRYDGILDGRQGKDHEPRFEKYYPSTASFNEVRGPRVYNCRCTRTPIHNSEWAELQREGSRVETTW